MKNPLRLIAVALTTLFSTGSLLAEVREWTRASDGRKITAEFAGMKDDSTAKIKMANGQIFEVPLTGLSAEDNAYIKEANAKMAGGAKPAGGPAPAVPEGETTVTLSKVHICCGDCVDAVAQIGSDTRFPVPAGVTITADRGTESIIVKAPTGKDAQAALRSILGSGFYGISDQPAVSIPDLKPDDFITNTMVVTGTHLCCGGCVRAFTKAVESVDGVESCEAKTGAKSVKVTGKDFKTYEVMKALREAGFGGSFQ